MLQLASWELRRRQRMLLTLGTPVWLAVGCMLLKRQTRRAYVASPKLNVDKEDSDSHERPEDVLLAKFSARRTGLESSSSNSAFPSTPTVSRKPKSPVSSTDAPDEFDAAYQRFLASRSNHDEEWDEEALTSRTEENSEPIPDDEVVPRNQSETELEAELKAKLAKQLHDDAEVADFEEFVTAPGFLLERMLYHDQNTRRKWKRNIALLRSRSVPVIIMQMYIRKLALKSKDGEDHKYLQYLPKGKERRGFIHFMRANHYTRDDLRSLAHILMGKNDQQRADRFLDSSVHKPLFLLHFLIDVATQIKDPRTVARLIDYCLYTYDGRRDWKRGDILPITPGRSVMPMLTMSPRPFAVAMQKLLQLCYRRDSRLVLKVANVVGHYLENMGSWDMNRERIFIDRCYVFNRILESMSPRIARFPPRKFHHVRYIWEAQRYLLTISSTFPKPLLVHRLGFRAIKDVLAGMEKNAAEIHSSRRHAASWPPYLKPSDGIDQMMEPEEGWSRTVQAGVLQQEAGFPEEPLDEVLNILQGRASDGSPTIQQRLVQPPSEHYTAWEASIRATRNAEEAWARFQLPPRPTMEPTVYEYAAMFAKLHLPDSEIASETLPGDKALNYQTKRDPNLSEFGISRLQPPSVGELYRHMKSRGVMPDSTCLEVLVRNASALPDGHRYLLDNGKYTILTSWSVHKLVPEDFERVPLPVFAAYIQLCARAGGMRARHMKRAIRFCELRFALKLPADCQWAPVIWGYILKELSSNRFRSLGSQLQTCLKIILQLENLDRILLPTVVQFAKTLKKSIRGQLDDMARSLERGSTLKSGDMAAEQLPRLYHPDEKAQLDVEAEKLNIYLRNSCGFIAPETGDLYPQIGSAVALFRLGAQHLKRLCKETIDDEAAAQRSLKTHNMDALDVMASRMDPVRAEDAYNLMLSFGFLGEFEEMAVYLGWLLRQWSGDDLLNAVEKHGGIPDMADLSKSICAFRLIAEPMLDPGTVETIQIAVEDSQLGWTWPDDEVVQLFAETEKDQGLLKLVHVLEWGRYRQGLEAEASF